MTAPQTRSSIQSNFETIRPAAVSPPQEGDGLERRHMRDGFDPEEAAEEQSRFCAAP